MADIRIKVWDKVTNESNFRRTNHQLEIYGCQQENFPNMWTKNSKRENKKNTPVQISETVLTNDTKCKPEIRRSIEITNDPFQKLSEIITNGKISFERMEYMLKSHLLPIGSEWWTIPSKMKRIIKAT